MPNNSREDDLKRRVESWAASPGGAEVPSEIQQKISRMLAPSLTPVKPLPSQPMLVWEFIAVFVACTVGLILILDKAGFHLMTGLQMAVMAAILFSGGVLFSIALATGMVPGARHRFPSVVLPLSGLGVITAMALLFPWHTSSAFFSDGWPCTFLEILIAIPVAVIFWLLARRGALFASPRLGAVLTSLAVFLALTPLQFQCMFQQAPHLLVWHSGAALLFIALGAWIGHVFRHRWIS